MIMELLWIRPSDGAIRWRFYGMAVLVVALCTLVAALLFSRLEPTNLCMIYLVGVVIVASRYGRRPSILASVLSVAAFDFFFIPPYLTFVVNETQYLVTFAVMLLVAIVISTLTVRINQQAQIARERERRTTQLYAMSREFANSRSPQNLMQVAAEHIGDLFHSRVVMFIPDERHYLTTQVARNGTVTLSQHEQGVAQWVYDHALSAGWGTDRLSA